MLWKILFAQAEKRLYMLEFDEAYTFHIFIINRLKPVVRTHVVQRCLQDLKKIVETGKTSDGTDKSKGGIVKYNMTST